MLTCGLQFQQSLWKHLIQSKKQSALRKVTELTLMADTRSVPMKLGQSWYSGLLTPLPDEPPLKTNRSSEWPEKPKSASDLLIGSLEELAGLLVG